MHVIEQALTYAAAEILLGLIAALLIVAAALIVRAGELLRDTATSALHTLRSRQATRHLDTDIANLTKENGQ